MRYTTKEYFDLNWTRLKNGGLIERLKSIAFGRKRERSDVNLGNFWLQIF
jgi:hypothetical protein